MGCICSPWKTMNPRDKPLCDLWKRSSRTRCYLESLGFEEAHHGKLMPVICPQNCQLLNILALFYDNIDWLAHCLAFNLLSLDGCSRHSGRNSFETSGHAHWILRSINFEMMLTEMFFRGSGGTFLATLGLLCNVMALLHSSFCRTFRKKFISGTRFMIFVIQK